jgi:hypothetical protein
LNAKTFYETFVGLCLKVFADYGNFLDRYSS